MATRSKLRNISVLLALTAVLVGVIVKFANPETWLPRLLIHDDTPQKADAIFLLMGSVLTRSPQAAKLYNQGIADRIIFATVHMEAAEKYGLRVNDADATTRMLTDLGVPKVAIHQLEDQAVSSTREEAQALFGYLKKISPEARRIIIVTDWYHTSRAHWIFQRLAPPGIEVLMSAAISSDNSPDIWLTDETTFILTFTEYLKWVFYLIHY